AVLAAAPVMAAMTVMVGGAPMYPTKNIVENAVNSKDHTTLVAAVKAAGRVTAHDLGARVDAMGGKAMLTTVQGEPLTVMRSGKSHLTITDAKGGTAMIT